MKIIGVYKITNPEGLVYIGSSRDLKKRMRSYRNGTPKNKKPRSIDLSIIKYGIDNHKFEIIERCDLSVIHERERFWQEELNTLHPHGLNRNLVSCPGKKQVASSETSRLISEHHKGSIPWNVGKPWCQETKDKISQRFDALRYSQTNIILDTKTGIYYYGIKDAARCLKMPNSTMKSHLTAPNCDRRTNGTSMIIV